MPDVPGFVGLAASGLLTIALFVITTQRGDIRDLASRNATEADWRRQWATARLVLALATLLLIGVALVAVPSIVDLGKGAAAAPQEWIAVAALLVGLLLWPFGAGNVRTAATHLASHRRRLYGDSS